MDNWSVEFKECVCFCNIWRIEFNLSVCNVWKFNWIQWARYIHWIQCSCYCVHYGKLDLILLKRWDNCLNSIVLSALFFWNGALVYWFNMYSKNNVEHLEFWYPCTVLTCTSLIYGSYFIPRIVSINNSQLINHFNSHLWNMSCHNVLFQRMYCI